MKDKGFKKKFNSKLISLNKFNNLKSRISFKSGFSFLKPIKDVFYFISNKIDDLTDIEVSENKKNKENKENTVENNVINKNSKCAKNSKFTEDNDNNIFNINNINNNISNNKNIQDKCADDFLDEISNDFPNIIEDNFDNEYYRRIEPSKEEIKHENYLKNLDNFDLKDLNRNHNDFNKVSNSNVNKISEEDDRFNKFLPKKIPSSEALTNDSQNFKSDKQKSVISGPLSDKFGNINKIEKEKNEKLDFKNFLNLDNLNLDKNIFKQFRKSLGTDDSKTILGAAIFSLILIVLLFSGYYFLVYQPFQDDLSTAKTNKFNELNSLFKGPLALDPNVLTLTSEIELAKSPEEINAIDIIRPATFSWREYQSKQINKTKDNFNRVMVTYETISSENTASGNIAIFNGNNGSNTNFNSIDDNNQISKAGFVYAESNNNINNKNVIMDAEDAKSLVNENDGRVLANIVFKKPDTVAVPVLIDRLQAGAGLISIGSIVDIYTLYDSNQLQSSDSSQSSSQSNSESSSISEGSDNSNVSTDSENTNIDGNSQSNLQSNTGQISTTSSSQQDSKTVIVSPDISGSTILAIMRSKDSGMISADYIKSQTTINGNNTNQVQNSKSFSTDVEEMIRGSISGGYNEKQISTLLNRYGLKLSDYERQSNLAEIDVQYLLLIEVPRNDVPFVINNMENIILTIPTSKAPDWMINELKNTYSKNKENKENIT